MAYTAPLACWTPKLDRLVIVRSDGRYYCGPVYGSSPPEFRWFSMEDLAQTWREEEREDAEWNLKLIYSCGHDCRLIVFGELFSSPRPAAI